MIARNGHGKSLGIIGKADFLTCDFRKEPERSRALRRVVMPIESRLKQITFPHSNDKFRCISAQAKGAASALSDADRIVLPHETRLKAERPWGSSFRVERFFCGGRASHANLMDLFDPRRKMENPTL
jgi:hypothetical protein